MGRELQRLNRRRKALKQIENILEHGNVALVIHYSCESFYNKNDGRSPRITSIAVRYLESGQTVSFSIHLVAEELYGKISGIDQKYDDLEREMLQRFFNFVDHHKNYIWIHWNMRDSNYGFSALEHRYRVLKGSPTSIDDDKKFDLARAAVDIYGIKYIGHSRLESIIKLNKITDKDFLSGYEEAKAFENREFLKLHQSTLRKVDTLANLFERISNHSLKTNSTWMEQRGFSITTLGECIKEHPGYAIGSILLLIMGLVVRFTELIRIFQ
jgi:hypothetical protein